MQPNCLICQAINERKVKIIYEDELIIAYLEPNPASIGHTVIVPKDHATIIEQIPDTVVGHMFNISNKISAVLFESLNIHGTNILVQNGIEGGQKHPHFSIQIIPRVEGDNINFQWKTLQPTQEELATAELQLKDHIKNIGEFEKEQAKPIELDPKKEIIVETEEEENYLIKQIRRIP